MIVETHALTVRFRGGLLRKGVTALDAVDLHVSEGDFFALLGENGAGKSTAMHCMAGLLRPTSGSVRVFGAAPEPGSAMFAGIGYLPEDPRYHDYLTVEEAVTYYAALSGAASPRARAAEWLGRLALADHRRMLIKKCSKGMKQKIGIAQCLVHAPRLLLLDEPMRGLDPMTVHLLRQALLDMNRSGTTIVMNSHLLGEVEQVARRVAVIHRGRVVAEDSVANLVRTDAAVYEVVIEDAVEVPPALGRAERVDGVVRGTVPADGLFEFMDYARTRSIRIVSCALKKETLEQRFVAMMTEGGGNV